MTRVFPGAIGEMLSRELTTWEEFGYRLGGEQLVMKVVDEVLGAPLPNAGESTKERVEYYQRYKSAVGYEG